MVGHQGSKNIGHGELKAISILMKRIGYVIEEIVAQSNLEQSFDKVLRGTHRKRLGEGKWLIAHREDFLAQVKAEILSGKIHLDNYHEKPIIEGGKLRNIQVFNMKDRIKINAVMSVVDAHLRPRYIRTTGASIKGRGMHDLKEQIQRDIAAHPELTIAYKGDVHKCYDTVRHIYAMEALHHVFKDKKLLGILEQFVFLLPDGVSLSMGMRSSQGVCNQLLSYALDHLIKDELGYKFYYRYCDDILALFKTKEEAWRFRDIVHRQIESIEQHIKPNERVFPIDCGIDFLGFVMYREFALLRKRVKKSFARKLHNVKSRKRRQEIIGSYYGMTKHGNCHNLTKKLLFPSEYNKIEHKQQKLRMKNFKDLGLQYQPTDGKKRFNGQQVRLNSIINIEIIICDYERDVKTQHGENRYLVSFQYASNGTPGKFFTNSAEMKSILDQVRELPDGFPFKTTIMCEPFENGRGSRYYFN